MTFRGYYAKFTNAWIELKYNCPIPFEGEDKVTTLLSENSPAPASPFPSPSSPATLRESVGESRTVSELELCFDLSAAWAFPIEKS